jgi:hypothetical protein
MSNIGNLRAIASDLSAWGRDEFPVTLEKENGNELD